ncbi:hypothetical protein ACFL96_19340 [Thermoproteota archaeon]
MNGIKHNVEQGAKTALTISGYHPQIGSDTIFRDIKEQGSYEIMKSHSNKLLKRIEEFYSVTLPLLQKVEESFKDTRKKIIGKWEKELEYKQIPNLSNILLTLYNDEEIIKYIYGNNKCDVYEVLNKHTTLRPLLDYGGVKDVEKIIDDTQPHKNIVEKAITQAQKDFSEHKIEKLMEDIRKKIGNPI